MTQAYGFTVEFEQFLPYVTQYVPDVSEFVAVNAIKQACIEFCNRTYYWQYSPAEIPLVENKNNYVVETPPDTKMLGILQVYKDDMLLIPKSPDELARIYRMSNWQTMLGTPVFYTRIIKPEIVVVPTPQAPTSSVLNLRVALAPTMDAQEVDSEIYEQWAEVIGWGARARLYGQPKQPYFDAGASMEAMRMFRAGIGDARVQVNKGLVRNSTTVEFQRTL